jgi:hypothetical protein
VFPKEAGVDGDSWFGIDLSAVQVKVGFGIHST